MRVLIAPDKFAGTLTAVEAAEAIAAGWRRRAPDDELDLAPMADGGPGFVDVLHAAMGGELLAVTAEGPHGERVPATVLRVAETAYVETAQVVGRHLVDGGAEFASTTGVAELILAAVDSGADHPFPSTIASRRSSSVRILGRLLGRLVDAGPRVVSLREIINQPHQFASHASHRLAQDDD